MTVIVWDGKTLAADRQANCCDMPRLTRKMRRAKDGSLLAWTGVESIGLILAEWYDNGCYKSEWPHAQTTDRWARLIVISSVGVIEYEQDPIPFTIQEPKMAWGSGRDFAMGALEMGADAVRAVEIASKYNNLCGFGVDTLTLIPVNEETTNEGC